MATEIPGFPGQTGYLWAYIVEEGLDLFFTAIGVPWVALILMFLQPFIKWVASFFQGRAATGLDSATDDQMLFMIASANPIAKLWGMAGRIYESKGYAISSTEPAIQAKWKALNEALRLDLAKQFTDNDEVFKGYGYLLSLHDPDSNDEALAGRAALDRLYEDAVLAGKLDPATGFPYPQKAPPPAPPPTPPVPPAPPAPPPPPAQKECTDPCQLALLDLVNEQVVPQLTSTASALRTIQTLLPNLPQLNQIATALTDLATCTCADFNALVNNWLPAFFNLLINIDGTPGPIATLLTPLVAPLDSLAASAKTLAAGTDPPPPGFWDAIIRRGSVDPQIGQLVTGWPWQELVVAITSMSRYLGGEIGEAEAGLGLLIQNVIEPWGKKFLAVVEANAEAFSDGASSQSSIWTPKLLALFKTIISDLAVVETDIPEYIFNTVANFVTGGEPSTTANVEANTFRTLGVAFMIGQALHLLSAIAGLIGYPISSLFGNNAKLIVDCLSFDDILAPIHKNFWPAALGNRAAQLFNAKFPTRVPPYFQGQALYARGKIGASTRDALNGYGGLDPAYADASQLGAYRPINARVIQRGFVNRVYPTALMSRILQDEGMNPEFIPIINSMFEEMTTLQVENQYLTELEAAFAKGAVPIDDLKDAMDNLNYSPQAQNLILSRAVLIQQQEAIAFVVKEYQPELAASLVSPATYGQALQAAGAQPWYVTQQVELAEAKAFVRGQIKAQAVAKKDADTIWTRESTTAVEQYLRGEIDLAALTLAVTTARANYIDSLPTQGLALTDEAGALATSPVIVTSTVASAQARTTLTKQFVYGLLLTRAEALILKEKVTALLAQFKETALTVPQLNDALRALNIPGANVEAIVAKAAASAETKYAYATIIEP